MATMTGIEEQAAAAVTVVLRQH